MIGIDTNILIYAHDATSPYHEDALNLMSKILLEDTVALANLSLIEFYAVMTDGRKVSNPLSQDEAHEIIADICVSAKFNVCHIDPSTFKETFRYAAEKKIKRYDIGDLFIAMSLAKCKVREMYTANEKDFAKFDFISATNPFHARGPGQTRQTKTIPYGRQSIDEKDVASVCSALRSDWLTQGPKVEEFENAIAEYCGAKYAVAVSNGTAALHAAYFAAGVGPGDEVITSPITFAATANAALYLGARPIFADTEPDTANISASLIEQTVTNKTKVIVPVNYAGHPADLDSILDFAHARGITVIEDACHALGTEYRGRRIGSVSDMTVFSFHPVKSITTGEGGVVLTNNKNYYEKLMMFRTHGITKETSKFENQSHGDWYYEMQFLGYNYRITDIQASLGISQLRKLDRFIEERRAVAAYYNEKFAGNSFFDMPPERDYARSSYHLYPIRLKDKYVRNKKRIFSVLRDRGIGVQVHYIPVYLQPYYRGLGYSDGLATAAENFYKKEISIPIYPGITENEIASVAELLLLSLEEAR